MSARSGVSWQVDLIAPAFQGPSPISVPVVVPAQSSVEPT